MGDLYTKKERERKFCSTGGERDSEKHGGPCHVYCSGLS